MPLLYFLFNDSFPLQKIHNMFIKFVHRLFIIIKMIIQNGANN